eukprot:165920-Prorocentrum_minimum.AAC.5
MSVNKGTLADFAILVWPIGSKSEGRTFAQHTSTSRMMALRMCTPKYDVAATVSPSSKTRLPRSSFGVHTQTLRVARISLRPRGRRAVITLAQVQVCLTSIGGSNPTMSIRKHSSRWLC